MITVAGVAYPEMADSISPANLNSLPFTPDAYLGYVDGRWPDYAQIAAQHGGKPCYGLTVTGNPNIGDGTDTEPGNVDIAGCVRATAAELARGVDRPIVYCPASWAAQVVQAHTAAGIDRSKYRLVTAHYGGPTMPGAPIPGMHICGPATCSYGPGSDGTQWQSLDAYDRSLLAPDFITAAAHPGPASTPEEYMKVVTATNPATGQSAEYLIRTQDVLHVPDNTCGSWAYAEFNGAQGQLEAVPWEIILWLNKGQVPA